MDKTETKELNLQPAEDASERPRKRALVFLYSTYVFLQFLWYANTREGREYSWDAVICDYGLKDRAAAQRITEENVANCERSSLVENIYYQPSPFSQASILTQCRLFLSLAGHWLIGQKRAELKALLKEQNVSDKYDAYFVSADTFLNQAVVTALSDELNVTYFEDGTLSYLPRHRYCRGRELLDPHSIIGMCLARMGYLNPSAVFEFDAMKNCRRLAAVPEEIEYRNYSSIELLFDMDSDEKQRFDSSVRDVFHDKMLSASGNYDVIFFSDEFLESFPAQDEIPRRIHSYMKENYSRSSILVKRHPRDQYEYDWDDLEITLCDKDMPGELLLLQKTDVPVVFMSASTLLITAKREAVKYTVLDYGQRDNDPCRQAFFSKWVLPDAVVRI